MFSEENYDDSDDGGSRKPGRGGGGGVGGGRVGKPKRAKAEAAVAAMTAQQNIDDNEFRMSESEEAAAAAEEQDQGEWVAYSTDGYFASFLTGFINVQHAQFDLSLFPLWLVNAFLTKLATGSAFIHARIPWIN